MDTQQKILFFDIDGTLLTPPPFSVPESTKLGLKKAQQNGHLTFVNTGRTFATIPAMIKEIDFDGFVCGCGTQIYLHGELLHSSSLSHELCQEIVDFLRENRIRAFFEASDRLLYDSRSPVQFSGTSLLTKDKLRIDDIAEYTGEPARTYTFDKLLVGLYTPKEKEIFDKFLEGKELVAFDHGNGHWEIAQKGCSKATGIQFLLNYFGLPLENSYAFGDSNNDLSMLQYAGTSIAMGNSRPEILPFCTYQTTDIYDDGIYNALQHFGLL